jgi:TolA-binding protein
MMETPDFSLLAIAVVGIGLTILGWFVREGVITSNIYKQAVKLYQEKNYIDAEAAFRQVISRHPSNDVVRLLLGEVLMQQDKLDEAIAVFRELIDRADKNVDAHLRLGSAFLKQDKLDEAKASLSTARDLLKAQRNTQKAQSVEQLLEQISTRQIT